MPVLGGASRATAPPLEGDSDAKTLAGIAVGLIRTSLGLIDIFLAARFCGGVGKLQDLGLQPCLDSATFPTMRLAFWVMIFHIIVIIRRRGLDAFQRAGHTH